MQSRTPPQQFAPRTGNNVRANKLKIEGDYDFEKANQEFLELQEKMANVTVSDEPKKPEEAPAEAPVAGQEAVQGPTDEEQKEDDEENAFYDKSKSFFDQISCEALERSKGKVQRVDWRQERKLNTETFGVSQNYRRGGYRGRGGYGYGYRGGYGQRQGQNYNRNYNNPQGGYSSRGGYNQMGGGGGRQNTNGAQPQRQPREWNQNQN
jgi:protein LSM14